MSPLNSRTATKMNGNSVSKFGGILFTPIRLTDITCYAFGHLKVRLSLKRQNVPLPPPKHLHKHRHKRRQLVTAHFPQLTNTVLTLPALIIACCRVHCELKYQHWPMKQILFIDQKVCQWPLCPYKSDKRHAHVYRCLQLQEGPQTCLL